MQKIASFALALALIVTVAMGAHGAFAQTYMAPGTTTTAPAGTVTTPGVPTTGAGGEMALNLAILLASGAVAVGGVTYLFRRIVAR